MAWKSKAKSDVVIPVSVLVGEDHFTCMVQNITPKQWGELNKATSEKVMDPDTGRTVDRQNNEKFANALFDLIFIRAEGLTPGIVEQMVEIEGDPLPVEADGTITDKEFLRFLFIEAPSRHFFTQVVKGLDRGLQIAKVERELRAKKSVSLPAE